MKGLKNRIRILSSFACVVGVTLLLGAKTTEAQTVGWQDIIGIIQAGNLVGSGTGQVQGGGQPWSTRGGEARVNLGNGNLHFVVHGLVFAGGNNIGTRGGNAQVRGTLVCDTNGSAGGGNSTLVDTPLVDFSPQGDARFTGNVGPLPAACLIEPDIAFLIRLPAGAWIANGAVRTP